MDLTKVANVIERGLSPVISVVNNIGVGVIVVMMLLTVANVVGRRFFNQPIFGAYGLSEFMLVIVVFFTIAHCELLRGHITIGLVVSRLRQRTQDVIDSTMYLFFLVTFCLLTWRLCLYAVGEWHGSLSGVLEVPIYPFIWVAALGCALLSLVVLTHLLLFLAGVLRK